MFAHAAEAGADGDMGDGFEANDVDDGDTVGAGGDISVETQTGLEEGWAMVAGEEDHADDQQNREEKEDPEAAKGFHSGLVHCCMKKEEWETRGGAT